MAEYACRSCGRAVPAGATTCPHCGAADPVAAHAVTEPTPERETAGSRTKNVVKAVGCVVLALIVLGIALVVGLFDVLF